MSAAHKKYVREQKAYDDKQQTTLNPKSPSFIQEKQQSKTDITDQYTGEYLCPFCLHYDKIEAYLISTSKGYHKGLGLCPECENKMRLESLTAEMTPEQYAEFMYGYSASGGWQKVKWEKWKQRMNNIGWTERFWLRYKQLKGDNTHETYQQYMERTQAEWAKEQGLVPE